MSNTVLDASVLLAILRSERLDAEAGEILDSTFISTVNLAEVMSRVQIDPDIDDDALDGLVALLQPEPFTIGQAQLAAQLHPLTRAAGLSLGDRACIALGAVLDADIYTADRAWAKVKLPYRIHLIR